MAPRVHTQTLTDVGGNAKAIDTRVPPALDMLKDDLYDVLGKKPVVLVFATPQLCQSRVCGPVVDVAEQVKSETKADVSFIHNEVYVDNNPNKGLRPQLTAYGLQTEPWIFVIDRTGKVVQRFEGAVSVDELKAAVAKVSDAASSELRDGPEAAPRRLPAPLILADTAGIDFGYRHAHPSASRTSGSADEFRADRAGMPRACPPSPRS